jgi:WD40-like Beta Propeller Repeat
MGKRSMFRSRSISLVIVLAAYAGVAVAQSVPSWTRTAPVSPEPFLPGIVSGPATEESMVSVAPDGQTLFWGASRLWFPVTRVAEVRTSMLSNGSWSPAQIAPFSSGFSDSDPFPLRDGSGIILSSMRPVDGLPRRDFDLWFVPRTENGFGRAANLGRAVNSDDDELYATVSADGTLYFGSDRTGLWRIYRAERGADGKYRQAEALPEPVNMPGIWSFNPYISSDGRTLLFTSLNRPSGFGKGDLWVARMTAENIFREPVNLGPTINTDEEEFHPTLSHDSQALIFIRRNTSKSDGNADAMWVAVDSISALGD